MHSACLTGRAKSSGSRAARRGDFQGRAEIEVAGDYEDYQIRVGLLQKRVTQSMFRSIRDVEFSQIVAGISTEKKRVGETEKKAKNKRKQEKKARKRHKKR